MSRAFPQLEMQPVYGFCHYVLRVIFDMVFRGDVVGVGNLPRHGQTDVFPRRRGAKRARA